MADLSMISKTITTIGLNGEKNEIKITNTKDLLDKEDIKFGLQLVYKANIINNGNTEIRWYILDFDYISSFGFGFSINLYDISGAGRKAVQQTRGNIEPLSQSSSNNTITKDNFYIDVYASGLDRLRLSGAVELPAGLSEKTLLKYSGKGSTILAMKNVVSTNKTNQQVSFNDDFPTTLLGALENMYQMSNNQDAITRGDEIFIHDFLSQKFYKVTIMDRAYSDSSDKQFIRSFNFSFIILDIEDISSI